MQTKTAIVIGGSMGGLFAANLLHRAGWGVTVLEKTSRPLTSRGTGIVTNVGLHKLLELAGAQLGQGLGVEIEERLAFDREGHELARCRQPQVLTAWSRLLSALLQAFPAQRYLLDAQVTGIDAGGPDAPARVLLSDGREMTAELVVAADGVRSMVRKQLFGAPPPDYAGYVAWRAVVDRDGLSPQARTLLGSTFSFSTEPGEEILSYPILSGHDEASERVQINAVWYRRTTAQALQELLTDAQGQLHAEGIAPQLLRAEVTRAVRDDAARLFHPAWSEVVGACDELILQPIVDSVSLRMHAGRVALIGDAAFVARPHVGQGVTKAGGDALALVQALLAQGDVLRALARFSAQRVPVGLSAVTQARRLGAPIWRHEDVEAQWSDYYLQAEHMIRDTAVELEGVAHTDAV